MSQARYSHGRTTHGPASLGAREQTPHAIRTTLRGVDAPLRILSVATEWTSGHGGISTLNRELCVALARIGHRVFCGVPRLTENERADASRRGVWLVEPVFVPGSVGAAALSRPFVGLEERIDVVIGHGRITGPAAATQVADRLRGALYCHFLHMDPNAIEWHKDHEGDATTTAEERVELEVALGRAADVIVAVGPELHDVFSSYFGGYSREVYEFLPGLFPTDGWSRTPSGRASCLVFGRAEDRTLKGVTIAAEAIGLVCADPGRLGLSRLVVRGAPAGTGDALQEDLRKASGNQTEVVVREYTSDPARIRSDIRSASLVLMPSLAEGFGLTGLEAISEGVPVLLSRRSGLARAIERHLGDQARIHIVDVAKGPEHVAERLRERLIDCNDAFHRARELRDALGAHFDWDDSRAWCATSAGTDPLTTVKLTPLPGLCS